MISAYQERILGGIGRILPNLEIKERLRISERILDEIRGRMTEDIILLETVLAKPEKQVFVMQFAVGEFDMVIFDSETISCQLYEIKHSEKIVAEQYRHLTNPDKLKEAEKQYGEIEGRFVIYHGDADVQDNINYLNVEEYLLGLKNE